MSGRSSDGAATEFLPLTPAVFEILMALADQERHGYAIMKEVGERTQGEVVLRPGTLYRAVSRLLANELIIESADRPDPAQDDERRKYYALSRLGRAVLKAETDRMRALVVFADEKLLEASGEA